MIQPELHARPRYLNDALRFRDTDLIKVITGVRRCGKSTLLTMIRKTIESENVTGRSFVSINLESKKIPINNEDDLYNYFLNRVSQNGRTYIFIDEPQRIKGWENAVNAMRIDFDCDIYLTGSNAYLLSSELATYLSGRYVEIKMLPLALSEYLDFCGISFPQDSAITISPEGKPILFDDMLERYMRFGGMPALASIKTTQEEHSAYLSSIYETIAVRDIVSKERSFGAPKVTDSVLLKQIAMFLADNVGNLSSALSVANTLTSSGKKTTNKTASSYINALCEAFLFYRVSRYDLHGKELLKTNPKHYIVDLGFRAFLLGYRMSDVGRLFENAVFLQLAYSGWSVHVGKIYEKEIDFIAIKDGQKKYIQVTDNLSSEAVRERELAPLRAIRDAYSKIIVVRQGSYESEIDGINIVSAKNFFCSSLT